MIIVSLISLVLIAVGCGQSSADRALENSRKALDDFRKSQDKVDKILDNYYRNGRP